MQPKDWEDRVEDAVETEDPPGTDYYGAEMDEAEVEAARERMEKATRTAEEGGASHTETAPVTRRPTP